MITLSLDEAGQYERNVESKCPNATFIGGVLFDDKGDAQEAEKEKIRIADYYRSIIKKCCGNGINVSYPESLHCNRMGSNKDKVGAIKNEVNKTLMDFIQKGSVYGRKIVPERTGEYYLYAIQKTPEGKEERIKSRAGFMLNDDYAANLYMHMVDETLTHLVFHNPVLPETSEFGLQLATRSSADMSSSDSIADEFKSQGSRLLGTHSENKFRVQITNGDVFRTLISQKLVSEDTDIVIRYFESISIDYLKTAGEGKATGQEFLYLADSVCSVLSFDTSLEDIAKVSRTGIQLAGEGKFLHFLYDEIDNYFTKAWNCYIEGDYYGALEACHDGIRSGNVYADMYEKTWFGQVIDLIVSSGNRTAFRMAVRKFNDSSLSNRFNNVKGAFIMDVLKKMLDRMPEIMNDTQSYEYLYMFFDTCVSAYCHSGNSRKALETYEQCRKYAYMTKIETFLRTQNKLAVSLTDVFEWNKAQFLSEGNLSYHRTVSDIKNEISNTLRPESYIEEAKAYSQLGQIYAFLRDKRAEAVFLKALGMLDRHPANYRITESYLLQYYLDNGDREHYEAYADEYFGGRSNAKNRFAYVLEKGFCDDSEYNFGFAMYVLVKGIYLFGMGDLSQDCWDMLKNFEKAAKEAAKKQNGRSFGAWEPVGHPYEMIYKYLCLIAAKRGDTAAYDEFRRGMDLCLNAGGRKTGPLLEAIICNNRIEVREAIGDEAGNAEDYSKIMEILTGNFDCFKGKKIPEDNAKTKEFVKARFTYMYH